MKLHQKFQHPLSKDIGFWGKRGEVDLRINFGEILPGGSFPEDVLHTHKTRTTYFCIFSGELIFEIEDEKISVTKDAMLEILPGEKYRTLAVGQDGCQWVVVGSHNQDDKVLL